MGEEFQLLIQQLPTLLQYYVPGYLFIVVYDFITSKNRQNGVNLHLECVVVSYVIVIIVGIILAAFELSPSYRITVLIEFAIAVFTGYIAAKFIDSDWCEDILHWLKINKSPKASIWDDYMDTTYGTFATVYLSSESVIYSSKVVKYDYESEESNYIALAQYELYSYSGKKLEEVSTDQQIALLKMDNIDRIEFYYDKRSRVIRKYIA